MKQFKPVILIVENSVQVTGAFNSVIRSCHYLKESFEFIFVVPRHSKVVPILEREGFQLYQLNFKELRKSIDSVFIYFPFLLVNAIRLYAISKRTKTDVIHVNDIYNMAPAVCKLFGLKSKLIVYVRFMPNRFPAWIFSIWWNVYAKLASQIVAVSNAVTAFLPPSKKLVVIYDPLPFSLSQLQPHQRENDEVQFLYLANYIPGKGHEAALRSFYNVFHVNHKVRLRFVGSDMGLTKNATFKIQLKKFSDELAISDVVEWADFALDVEQEIRKADVVLNYSESESLSLTCVEAMYFGRPVIATASGGPQELIEHLKSGYIVPVGDINAMVEAMILLASNRELSNELARGGYYAIREKLSENNTVLRLSKCYDLALKTK